MSFTVKTSSNKNSDKLTYNVLIENQPDGKFQSILIGLPNCQGIDNTETEAMEKLIQIL